MIVRFSKRADAAVDRIAARWLKHADYPGVFLAELRHLVETLETTRSVGAPVPTRRHPALKRMVLSKSRCHVYFEIEGDSAVILEVRDARRRQGPKL